MCIRDRLEGDDQRRPSSPFAGVGQRHCFGVPITVFRVPSFTYRLTISQDYCSHQGVLLDPSPTPPSQVEGASHGLPLVHPALEAHSQAEAGEELPLRGVKVVEVTGQVLIFSALIADLAGKTQN